MFFQGRDAYISKKERTGMGKQKEMQWGEKADKLAKFAEDYLRKNVCATLRELCEAVQRRVNDEEPRITEVITCSYLKGVLLAEKRDLNAIKLKGADMMFTLEKGIALAIVDEMISMYEAEQKKSRTLRKNVFQLDDARKLKKIA